MEFFVHLKSDKYDDDLGWPVPAATLPGAQLKRLLISSKPEDLENEWLLEGGHLRRRLGPPKVDAELLVELKKRLVTIDTAIIVAIIGALSVVVSAYVSRKGDSQASGAALLRVEAPPRYNSLPDVAGMIADFGGAATHRPLNSFGETFNIISDAEWDGSSTFFYKGMAEPGSDNLPGFLRLEYQLRPNTAAPAIRGYGGIWTDFSFPPAKYYDISRYSRLSIDLRFGGSKPAVFVALAAGDVEKKNDTVGYYDWDEIEIQPHFISENWMHAEVELGRFHSPEWAQGTRWHVLDPHRVFRIMISVKAPVGESLRGYLDIDNIRFVK